MSDALPFLIVGQGIAGTLLAWQLQERNLPFIIIDQGHETASTRSAAGLINPVTGRRFVKSWRIDELLPYARKVYQKMEQQLGKAFYFETAMLRTFKSADDQNQWQMRLADTDYQPYLAQTSAPEEWATLSPSEFGYGETLQVAQVDVPAVITAWRMHWAASGNLREAAFDYDALVTNGAELTYQGASVRAVIFAQGWQGISNPFFENLPLVPSKGEVLFIDIPALNSNKAFKKDLIFAPLQNGKTWVGSANKWHTTDHQPTAEGRQELIQKLATRLPVNYTIEHHDAGIRPAVKDRRPLIGKHPKLDKLFFFNGLGAKGTSLAPLLAQELLAFVMDGKPLDPMIDLMRYVD